MTKSKKLISMILAFVMLVSSCSMSLFAYADDAAVNEAKTAIETALASMSANTVGANDTAMVAKVNALTDAEVMQLPATYYAYVLHVATTQMLKDSSTTVNATNRFKKLKALADAYDPATEAADSSDAVVTAYRAFVKVPDEYIQVLYDLNAANVQAVDDSYATNKPRLITDANTNALSFQTNTAAKAQYEAFIAAYSNYSQQQIDFADFIILSTASASTGITGAFTSAIAKNVVKTKDAPYDTLDYYFADRQANRFANLYYTYKEQPIVGTSVKPIYVSGSAWKDAENGPTEYYNLLKDFFTNANAKSKDFYVSYIDYLQGLTGLYTNSTSNPAVSTSAIVGEVIDVGLAIIAEEEAIEAGEENVPAVDYDLVKKAYKDYEKLSPAAQFLVTTLSSKVTGALFNITLKNVQMKGGVNFEDDAASIEFLTNSPTIIQNTTYEGTTFEQLAQKVADRYAEFLPVDEYKTLVNETVAKATITADDVTAVWTAFGNLSTNHQKVVRNTSTLWENTQKIMTSQFVQCINGIQLDSVTADDIDDANAAYDGLLDEFKALFEDDDNYIPYYEKYLQIQIALFRYFIDGINIDQVTQAQREQAATMYSALSDELKAVVQADDALYSKYLAILASEFKDYINSIDEVTDAVRQEAQEKYEALSDAAKETVYNDAELWDKYCRIQTPETDPDNHAAEAAKVADKVTQPSKEDSEAVKDLGVNKSIDNVEDFIIDDLLPFVTDQIKITDKNDAVNSALEKHYTNATIGKIYAFYAELSHNQTEIEGQKVGTLVQTQLIPPEALIGTLYEDDFNAAKAKMMAAEIPTDDKGDPEELDIIIGYDYNNNPIYETANIYDGIAAIEFESGDFGFEDGDKEGFTKALLAALRPITGLCAPGSPLGIEFFNHVDKKTGKYTMGIYECALTLLESLGVTGLPTNDAFQLNYYNAYQEAFNSLPGDPAQKQQLAAYLAGDALLKPILDGVFAFIDSELKTFDDVLALIPRLGDLIRSDIPLTVYTNLHADLGMLSGLIENIEVDGSQVPLEVILNPYVLPDALVYIINEKLLGDTGIVLMMPNWEELNKYTTFKVNPSSQQNKDYVAVRYINGKAMFSELLYYAYDNLIADDANATALKDTLGGVPLVGSNIAPLVDNAKEKGKMKTYAAILDYFYESEDEKNYDATADAGKSIGDAIAGINDTLNFGTIDCSKAVIKLSKKKFNYNGKIQKPSVTVTLNGEKLVKGTAYKVTYSNSSSKKLGKYKIKVTFIGAYEGPTKTYTYTIGPKNARKFKATAKSGAIKATWKRSASKSAKGYVIQYSTNSKFKNAKLVTVSGRSKTSKTIKGLDSGKKYYVRIKAYAVKGGKKIYSAYTTKKAVTVK